MPIITINSLDEIAVDLLRMDLLNVLKCKEEFFKILFVDSTIVQSNEDVVINVTWMPRSIDEKKEITKVLLNYYSNVFVYFQDLETNSVFTKERI